MIVQQHPTPQPAEAVKLLRQPLQLTRAAHPLDAGVPPEGQHHPRIRRRTPRRMGARTDRTLQRRKIQPLDISRDHPRHLIGADQTVDSKRSNTIVLRSAST